jgi:hypothetical protein
VPLAAVIAVRDGQQPRLIYRVHDKSRRPGDKRKGFTETDYARLLAAAHQQLGGAARAGLGLCSAEHNPSSVPAGLCGQRRLAAGVTGGGRLGAVMAGHIIITARQAS